MRLSDEEINQVKVGLVKDKINDLELESTQLGPTEGPEITMGGLPTPPPPMPGIDLGGPPTDMPPGTMAEKSKFSVHDETAPIRAQNIIDQSTSFLNEEIEEEDSESEKNETEFEKWQKEASLDSKIKRSKAKHKEDAGVEDIMSYKGNDGKHDASGMPRLMYDLDQLNNPVKNLGKMDVLKEEDFDITEYLDMKVAQNAKMTGRIQSTLKRFDSEFGKPAIKGIIISENNSSEEKE